MTHSIAFVQGNNEETWNYLGSSLYILIYIKIYYVYELRGIRMKINKINKVPS